MSERRTIWEWATDYVGDPDSWGKRGQVIFDFLREEGLIEQSRVLNVGCGNLSEGTPLIRYLRHGCFVGLEPNGWLVEAALAQKPTLAAREPQFLWRSDFDASELGVTFDYIVSHSVLSHCAHWQLDQLLANTRKVVDEGAIFLCSFRNDQYNSWHEQWQYPGVSTFRLQTVMAAGWQFGWRVEIVPEYRERLSAECPNDVHDWLRLTAVPTAAELNERRLREEESQREEKGVLADAEFVRVESLRAADAERIEAARLAP